IEMPELCIHRADFVEAHLVNQLLEHHWIVGEQIHAPLPIIEADRAGDDLLDLSGIPTANEPMFIHLARALFNRQRVPVLIFTSAPVHGIETYVSRLRNFSEKSWMHGFALPSQSFADCLLPFIGVRFKPLCGHLSIGLRAGLVEPK